MPDRPLVAVQAVIPRLEDDEPLYELSCSACGLVEAPGSFPRHELQRLADRHAWDRHGGDVDREGWA